MGFRIIKAVGIVLVLLPALSIGKEYGNILDVKFIRNHDGDTFTAELGPPGSMPELFRVIGVRLKGVDTPEKSPKCKDRQRNLELQALAKKAEVFLFERLSTARRIDLMEVERGRYFRVVARVIYDGKDIAGELLSAGLAKSTQGRKKRAEWC